MWPEKTRFFAVLLSFPFFPQNRVSLSRINYVCRDENSCKKHACKRCTFRYVICSRLAGQTSDPLWHFRQWQLHTLFTVQDIENHALFSGTYQCVCGRSLN